MLLGDDAAGLSATNIARLTAVWEEDYRRFRQRDLADRDYVYVWVDGIHFNIRLEDDRLCTAARHAGPGGGGRRRRPGFSGRPCATCGRKRESSATGEDGYRESTDSWATVLRDLQLNPVEAGSRGPHRRVVPYDGKMARDRANAAGILFDRLSSFARLWELVLDGEAEGLHLECKAPHVPRLDRRQRVKLASALSGFSNTGGGVIVWGMGTNASHRKRPRRAHPNSTTSRLLKNSAKWDRQIDPGVLRCSQHV